MDCITLFGINPILGIKLKDQVICQSMIFSVLANSIIYKGTIPDFVDSVFDTWNICPEFLEVVIKDRIAIGKKLKVIIVHLYGWVFWYTSI
ncbi:DegT/DnrJ/EryC1/StrS family aminotransferase [Flavobacterium sp. F-65]|uniref:DegT/DnrJ/EryC1/StrS family aminotransferase n=1 Tax=Flavobacterium pisciphilum TaxID=2893755 RepID=A0ABS8MSS7_9FLAO|nr:DegT/DnrJ/EryC1/StrS family aminotransferase [Flavobacterium sp. F-65]